MDLGARADGVERRRRLEAQRQRLGQAHHAAGTDRHLAPFLDGGAVHFGLHYLLFESRQAAPANALLFSVALRAGFRFLRFYGFDLDLFAQLHLPLYKTNDPDSTLNAWTPYVMTGLGVAFEHPTQSMTNQ